MRRRKITPLVFIVLVAIGAITAVFATGTSPALGLDLQGGISVVLQPVEDADEGALDQTIEIIRNRVDALGVAEPDITRQGGNVVVQLPGVKNQERALELVGDTAELRFRPVLAVIPGSLEDLQASAATSTTATTAPAGDSTTTTVAPPVEGQSAAGAATPFQEDPNATTTTVALDPNASSTTVPTTGEPSTGFEVTSREDDDPAAQVVLEEYVDDDPEKVAFTYQLGPAMVGDKEVTGRVVKTARAELGQTGQWSVPLEFHGGAEGIDLFNQIAAECNAKTATCPSGQLAIVLDSVVKSAPTISQPSYEADQVVISGSFTEREAKDLALVLRYGSLPINLEAQDVRTVSATLGEDSLRAGLAAGLVGLALVCLYMIFYYRALGLVVVLGLAVWSSLNYSIIAWFGESRGLALGLAGVTGIVVSVGVTVDSYVVYFERLKDELKLGRTLRTTTERSFQRAFRTILAADISSFIGAGLLYWLTVGQVRGFAFFLGLSTILDVVVAWFFTRPMVGLLAQSRLFTGDHWLGLSRGLGGARLDPDTGPVVAPAGGGR